MSDAPNSIKDLYTSHDRLTARVAELEQLLEIQRCFTQRLTAHNRALIDALRDISHQTGVVIPDELFTTPKETTTQ